MSIILKGIDIPEKENRMYMMELYADGHCSVAKIENGECYELTIPSETEAVQIPKDHGRIGDLDGVIKQIDESPTFASKYKGTARLFIDVYSDSNTILEAEE